MITINQSEGFQISNIFNRKFKIVFMKLEIINSEQNLVMKLKTKQ